MKGRKVTSNLRVIYLAASGELTGVSPEDFPALAQASGFDFLLRSPAESASYHLLKAEYHRHPFDRMLIHQATIHNLTLLTKDKAFSQYRSAGLKQLW